MTWLKIVSTLALALCFSSAFAAPATVAALDEIHKQTHYSMVLTGWIDIDREGAVTGHRLDQDVAKLSPSVVKWVADAVSEWRFAPHEVNGATTAVQAQMRLRLLVEPIGAGDTLRVRVASAKFGVSTPGHHVTFEGTPRHRSWAYPKKASKFGVGGVVYLAIQVGRDGNSKQIVAQQVNLTVVDDAQRMDSWRSILAEAAVRVSKKWRFVPPVAGPEAAASEWTVVVPIEFNMQGRKLPQPGEWALYIPGPKHPIPWEQQVGDKVAGIGAMSPGEIHTLGVGVGLRLLTPLGDG